MTGLMRSWVASANDPTGPFPLNNLPYGVFSSSGAAPRCGVAIGDQILDLASLEARGTLRHGGTLQGADWCDFMALGRSAWTALRKTLTAMLAEGSADESQLRPFLVPMAEAQMHMPFRVSEYTDFYSGRNHAFNVGALFRDPENALPPNWLHIPIGYNGRASSVVVSGTDVVRPHGQIKRRDDTVPRFAPSARFDIELELGAIVGSASDGPLTVADADAALFGYVLLNDWSARDIQAWEYQPLGPFQAKATATSISPWIVTADALAPFRVGPPPRDVALLDYLHEPGPMNYDIALEVALAPEGGQETVIARTNADQLYYSAAQQLAHHASSGCPMRVGDLLGSGTISGPTRDSRGSLLELSWGGREAIAVGDQERRFLEDGDRVTLRGAAQGDGYRIGFGDCVGTVLPARQSR